MPRPAVFSRRSMIAGAGLMFAAPSLARAAARLGEDGLYHEDWYLESFLDLAEDLGAATARGKRLAVLWGLKGCPACKKMHEVHMRDEAITGYIKARFDIVHLNIIGAREVTDFDGRKHGEKAFGQLYGIRTTPSIQFFGRTAEGLAALEPMKREVARMPGLLEPKMFLAMFRFVAEEGYARAPFTEWVRTKGT